MTASICALERPLPGINLMFTWKRPLIPQQPISAPAPLGPTWWRTPVGICGEIESEMVADLDRNRSRIWSPGWPPPAHKPRSHLGQAPAGVLVEPMQPRRGAGCEWQ